jgi:hypothetical protein
MRLINCSVVIGFLMKQPILLSGCTSLAASILISPAVIKQTLALRSLRTKLLNNKTYAGTNSSIPISIVVGVISPNGSQVSGYGNIHIRSKIMLNGDSSSSGFEEYTYNKDGYTLYEIDILLVYLVQIQVYIFPEKRYS